MRKIGGARKPASCNPECHERSLLPRHGACKIPLGANKRSRILDTNNYQYAILGSVETPYIPTLLYPRLKKNSG